LTTDIEKLLKIDLSIWLSNYGFIYELETLDSWWINLPWSFRQRAINIYDKYDFDCHKRQVIAALYREYTAILEKPNQKDIYQYDPLEAAERDCDALDKKLANFIASGGIFRPG
jgi:hypothetical protein